MQLIYNSFLYSLCMFLAERYSESRLRVLIERFLAFWGRAIHESRLLSPLFRESAVHRCWPDSLTCRALSFVIGLPGLILNAIYRLLTPLFEDSFFSRLAFEIGDESAITESWCIAALWVIPFAYWNNAWSLMAFSIVLVLYHLSSMHRVERRLDLKSIGLWPLVFFLAVVLAARFSVQRSSSMRFLGYHAAAALCVLATVSVVRHAADLKRLAAGSSVCVLISSGYGIFQRIRGVEVNKSYVDIALNPDMPGRVPSFFDNPNTFAEVLILLLPLTLALILLSRRPALKAISTGIFALGTAALAMTYSRASWVGFALSLAVFVLLWRPRLIPLFALICLAAIPLLPSTVYNRILTITNFNDSSTASRIPLYEATIYALRARPLRGAGLGTAAVQWLIGRMQIYHEHAPYVHAHNFYLQVWIETGLLGLFSFLATLLTTLRAVVCQSDRCADSDARTIACAGAASLAGAMICGMGDYLWNYPRVMVMFWFVFAMTLTGLKLMKDGEEIS